MSDFDFGIPCMCDNLRFNDLNFFCCGGFFIYLFFSLTSVSIVFQKMDVFYLFPANTEVVTDDEDGLQHMGNSPSPQEHKKRRGLRRLFGK